jgi:predicted RNA-binding Zn-ribbon protein involved in translation (DUF1610 family)
MNRSRSIKSIPGNSVAFQTPNCGNGQIILSTSPRKVGHQLKVLWDITSCGERDMKSIVSSAVPWKNFGFQPENFLRKGS